MNENFTFGNRLGLIGDAHGNRQFLVEAIYTLHEKGATDIIQLGDFGLFWEDNDTERNSLSILNNALNLVDRDLYVILGNHENYDYIEELPTSADGTKRVGRIIVLPRSGRGTAGERVLGFLSGAPSIDRSARAAGISWWPEELTTDEQAQPFLEGEANVDIVLAHDALQGQSLVNRLARSRHIWRAADLLYAEDAGRVFTKRVLSVINDGGVVVSGHYHFRHSEWDTYTTLYAGEKHIKSEILTEEWNHFSVGILDTETLKLDAYTVSRNDVGQRGSTFRDTRKESNLSNREFAEALGISSKVLSRLTSGHLAPTYDLIKKASQLLASKD